MKFDDTYFMLFPYPICINLSSEQLNARFCRSHWQQHGTTLLHKAFLASRFVVIWLPICESTRKCTLGLSICYQPWTQKGYSGKVSLKHEHCNIVTFYIWKDDNAMSPFKFECFRWQIFEPQHLSTVDHGLLSLQAVTFVRVTCSWRPGFAASKDHNFPWHVAAI